MLGGGRRKGRRSRSMLGFYKSELHLCPLPYILSTFLHNSYVSTCSPHKSLFSPLSPQSLAFYWTDVMDKFWMKVIPTANQLRRNGSTLDAAASPPPPSLPPVPLPTCFPTLAPGLGIARDGDISSKCVTILSLNNRKETKHKFNSDLILFCC